MQYFWLSEIVKKKKILIRNFNHMVILSNITKAIYS